MAEDDDLLVVEVEGKRKGNLNLNLCEERLIVMMVEGQLKIHEGAGRRTCSAKYKQKN